MDPQDQQRGLVWIRRIRGSLRPDAAGGPPADDHDLEPGDLDPDGDEADGDDLVF